MLYKLAREIADDPTGLGLAAKSDAAIAAALNAATVVVDRDTATAAEVFECIVPAEWAAATAQEKTRVQLVLGMGTVNLRGANTRAALAAAFGPTTTTRANILALLTMWTSRAAVLGLGEVLPVHVAQARAEFGKEAKA